MISIPQLLIIAVIIALLFGTKRLRSLGSDLGEAIKGFKKSVKDEESSPKSDNSLTETKGNPIKEPLQDSVNELDDKKDKKLK